MMMNGTQNFFKKQNCLLIRPIEPCQNLIIYLDIIIDSMQP
eukprot:SAG31_NODE_37614_length_302_cov_6.620690_1_plen_40_part_10